MTVGMGNQSGNGEPNHGLVGFTFDPFQDPAGGGAGHCPYSVEHCAGGLYTTAIAGSSEEFAGGNSNSSGTSY